MGWHTRHASTSSGLEGHLRPETLNLTAWNHALGLLHITLTSKTKKNIDTLYNRLCAYIYFISYIYGFAIMLRTRRESLRLYIDI